MNHTIAKPFAEQSLWKAPFSLTLLVSIVVLISILMGSYELSIAGVWHSFWERASNSSEYMVVWTLRLPRALAAALAGAMFGLSGAVLQNVTRNPLADPSIIGVSQGASLFVVTAIVIFPELNLFYRPAVALAGAILVASAIQALSIRGRDSSSIRFILIGIGIAAFISAMISAMLTYGRINQAQEALSWLSGSVYLANWDEVLILSITLLLSIPFLIVTSHASAALQMGEEIATCLGVSVFRTKNTLISISVILAAVAVSVVGPLSFVGLIAPHFAARLFRTSIGLHLTITALIGAFMVTISDLIGRTIIAPFQIPAGLVTVLIGVPIFLSLMLKKISQH